MSSSFCSSSREIPPHFPYPTPPWQLCRRHIWICCLTFNHHCLPISRLSAATRLWRLCRRLQIHHHRSLADISPLLRGLSPKSRPPAAISTSSPTPLAVITAEGRDFRSRHHHQVWWQSRCILFGRSPPPSQSAPSRKLGEARDCPRTLIDRS
ncbi:hypothetical protein DFJ73DRAFT_276786 [Zopfochytrium polystomum]|nr:hypothetical protein DFJ73DRAFT_276786 [Zopfochytrium polystomum]